MSIRMIRIHLVRNLSFLHLNIRSITNKIDNFSNFLEILKIKFPIIGISETWLDDSFHCVDIPGYSFFFT